MTPSKARTRPGGSAEARNRRLIAASYLQSAELASTDEGLATNNVVVGSCVLAGIAAGDAICLAAVGERYVGTDHAGAATMLGQVHRACGGHLATLVRLKPLAHYGTGFVSEADALRALRAARALVETATLRTVD